MGFKKFRLTISEAVLLIDTVYIMLDKLAEIEKNISDGNEYHTDAKKINEYKRQLESILMNVESKVADTTEKVIVELAIPEFAKV